jgi:hypothetical protein
LAKQLSPKQQRFIAELQKGATGTQAAIAAGYSARSAKHIAHQLLHENKLVRAELERIKQAVASATGYDSVRYLAMLEAGFAFSQKTNQASAMAKFAFLIGKHTGQIEDTLKLSIKHEIDVKTALDEAKARAGLRLMCDLPDVIEGECKALPGSAGGRAVDCESIGPFGSDH